MATQEYWPPATGQPEHISAMANPISNVNRQTPTQPNIITGGPPACTPTMKTPLSAVQLVPIREKFARAVSTQFLPGHDAEAKTDHIK